MYRFTPVALALLSLSAQAQLPANPSKITVEVGNGSTVTKTVRPDDKTRNVHITHNPSDSLTVIDPPHMTSGWKLDKTTLPPFPPGYSDVRIRETTEQPVPNAGGAFRTVCDPAMLEENDPIVYPQQPGKSHSHDFRGNTGVDAFTDALALLTYGNSTCRGGIANRSSYWIGALFDMQTSKPLLADNWLVYYKGADWKQSKGYGWYDANNVWHPALNKFPGYSNIPQGMKLIAGEPGRTTPRTSSDPFTYRWNCRINNVNNFGSIIPQTCPLGSTLGLEIFMPPCWDGRNLDSPDHKSHMSYPVLVKNDGDSRGWSHYECPATHPKPIPQISFSLSWTVTLQPMSRYRLVCDMDVTKPAGPCAHGDWFSGWKQEVIDQIVEECIRQEKDCHAHLIGKNKVTGKFEEIY